MMQAEEYLEKIPMWTREKHSLTDIRAFLHEMGQEAFHHSCGGN